MHATLPFSILALITTSALATPAPLAPRCTVELGNGLGTKGPGDWGIDSNGDWYFVDVGCGYHGGPCGGECNPQICNNPPEALDVSCIPGSTYIQVGDVRFCDSNSHPRSGGNCNPGNGCVNGLC